MQRCRVYHVLHTTRGWLVKAVAGPGVLGGFPRKAEAVAHALRLARLQRGARVVVHRADGRIQAHYGREPLTLAG